ncbi:neutral zinc metallopeptidase [Streptococcus pluranimalium]|uniref:KPN_02809 family neutral zinc metallopeptidase n=1 Tax=Streptococcus pluranimalium TaxID=82348 RepID=UPI002A77FF99|nr:neutral zinc metallopeptidase [Streptococcus pluranimalium]
MKIDDLRKSSNIDDRRGQQSYGSSRAGGMGGGALLSILFSRGSWKMKLFMIIILLMFGGGGALSGIFTGGTSQSYQSNQITQKKNTNVSDADAEFVSKVLGSTEDYWNKQFKKEGMGDYTEPELVFYSGQTSTACGVGQAASGPFYCPADEKIYLDLSFYDELSNRYGAKGDFALAYVIAHEVGHHVQNELGTMAEYTKARRGKSEAEANQLNVRLELQADYYAGAWANYVKDEGLLEKGDVQEAMQAAHAVGDDTLQEEAYGRVVPDSFTHGTSEQRQRWFDKGYQYGDISHGTTFQGSYNDL